MGGGGQQSSQPTQTTVQNTNIPDYARPYVETMLGATQQQLFNTSPQAPQYDASGNQTNAGAVDITGVKPYVPYSTNPSDYVASFSPLQTQAQTGVADLTTPGQFDTATGLTGAATMGAMGAGSAYDRMATSPYAVGAFMNPYISQSLQPQLNEIARQGQIQAQQAAGQATAAGAFGGTRNALMQNEAARNALNAQQQAIGQGYNTAYQNAQQAMQYGAGLGLQGQQAAMQGAGQLANIGGQQLAAQQGILGLQNQVGAQQQAQQQNIINQAVQNYATAQQYPQQQLAFMNSMIRGLPLQTMTTQGYQAAPSTVSQLAGLGTAGLGAYGLYNAATKKEGGVIKTKKYAAGGITSIDQKILNNPTAFSAQEITNGINHKAINPMIGAIALNQINNAPKAPAQAPQGTVLQGLEAAAQQQPQEGIPQLPSNLPVHNAAQGGIIAFAGEDGSLVEDSEDEFASNRKLAALNAAYEEELGKAQELPEGISAINLTQPESKQSFGIDQTAPTGAGIRAEAKAPSGVESLSDRERLHKHVLAKESGGHRYDKEGKLLTSSKGAQGEMQVMPFTQRDPGFGVKPAKDNSPEEMARVGRDYLDAMYKEFGDPKLAAIAYNMGPGATKKWLASNKGIDALPRETQKYIVGLASGGKVRHFATAGLVPGFDDFTGGEPYATDRNPKVGTKEVLDRLNKGRPSIEDLLNKGKPSAGGPNIPKSIIDARNAGNAYRGMGTTLGVPLTLGAMGLGSQYLQNEKEKELAARKDVNELGTAQNIFEGEAGLYSPDTETRVALNQAKVQERMNPNPTPTAGSTSASKGVAFEDEMSNLPQERPDLGGITTVYDNAGAGSDKTEAAKPKTAEEELADYLKDIRANISKQREQDKNMALIAAGLGIAGGTSPNALTNIGQGAMKGVEAQMAANKQLGEAEKMAMLGQYKLGELQNTAAYRKQADLTRQQNILGSMLKDKRDNAFKLATKGMGILNLDTMTQDQFNLAQKRAEQLLAGDKEYRELNHKFRGMAGLGNRDWSGWSGSKA